MPTLHKIVFASSVDITEPQANFIKDVCPEHGQMGEGGAYYINDEVLHDMKNACDQLNDDERVQVKLLIAELKPIIDKEGLYEFYLED